jgi:hypothetical protein
VESLAGLLNSIGRQFRDLSTKKVARDGVDIVKTDDAIGRNTICFLAELKFGDNTTTSPTYCSNNY